MSLGPLPGYASSLFTQGVCRFLPTPRWSPPNCIVHPLPFRPGPHRPLFALVAGPCNSTDSPSQFRVQAQLCSHSIPHTAVDCYLCIRVRPIMFSQRIVMSWSGRVCAWISTAFKQGLPSLLFHSWTQQTFVYQGRELKAVNLTHVLGGGGGGEKQSFDHRKTLTHP